jgi:hypothetical protein
LDHSAWSPELAYLFCFRSFQHLPSSYLAKKLQFQHRANHLLLIPIEKHNREENTIAEDVIKKKYKIIPTSSRDCSLKASRILRPNFAFLLVVVLF